MLWWFFVWMLLPQSPQWLELLAISRFLPECWHHTVCALQLLSVNGHHFFCWPCKQSAQWMRVHYDVKRVLCIILSDLGFIVEDNLCLIPGKTCETWCPWSAVQIVVVYCLRFESWRFHTVTQSKCWSGGFCFSCLLASFMCAFLV